MRKELNDLEKASEHRILCITEADLAAVFQELDRRGYTWVGGSSLGRVSPWPRPNVLFTYPNGASGRVGKKIVLQSKSEMEITAGNKIVTAAEWLRKTTAFDGVDCTVPKKTAY